MTTKRLAARVWFRLLLGLACVVATPAWATSEWQRDADGECVRVWNASELSRGPIAMTNGLILPVREFVGGLQDGAAGIVLSPVSAVAGVLEGAGWIVSGLLDTVTGGAFAISPDGMATLRVEPVQLLPEGRRSFDEYRDSPLCEGDPPLVPRYQPLEAQPDER